MARTSSTARKTDDRWSAVVARRTVSEPFVYAVRTTGIFCRPDCRSRRPNRKNVLFFDSASLAQAAGYRACRRCRPERADAADPATDRLTLACRFIDEAESPPRLAAIADHVGLSAYYLHRLFRMHLGVTPREYASARRADRLRQALEADTPVSNALYAAGYESSGRGYAQAPAILGMTPRQYKDKGRHARIRFATASCALGRMLVAVTDRGVCRIAFGDNDSHLRGELKAAFPQAEEVRPDAAFARTLTVVAALVDKPSTACKFPLDIQGSAFQQRVWRALRTIPSGETRSYAQLAKAVGRPAAVRAVAAACAANPVAVAVPCHRVVRSDGTLGGYRWGLKRKQALLDREAGLARRNRGRTAWPP